MYRTMVRIRACEEGIAARYAEQEMRCPVHLCIGQEAVAAGVCEALRPTDQVFSGHRAHGHYLAKGGSMRAMMAELYGRATGCCGGKGGSMHLVDRAAGFMGSVPIVASTIPIAVGAALASKMRGEDKVTVVFFGDGATEEGVFHEALNFAALKRLPVVFVCENNAMSVYSPLAVRRPAEQGLLSFAAAVGIDTDMVDGSDGEAVFEAASEAVAWARMGSGPTMLECSTMRLVEHCGPAAEAEDAEAVNPLKRGEEWLRRGHGGLPVAAILAMGLEAREEVADAVEFARSSPRPDERNLYENIA